MPCLTATDNARLEFTDQGEEIKEKTGPVSEGEARRATATAATTTV